MKRCDLSGPSIEPGFFGEDGIAGPRLLQFLDQDALGALVGDGDEIRRALHRDLQVLHFAEIADELAPRFARGSRHHVQGGREIGHSFYATDPA